MPLQVAVHLVMRVKPVFDKAGREAQGHAGVVRPLTREQIEWTATDHVGQRREGTTRLELDRCPNGVAHGQTQQGATGAIEPGLDGLVNHRQGFTHRRQLSRTCQIRHPTHSHLTQR